MIVALKDTGKVSDLLTYEYYLSSLEYEEGVIYHRECRFNHDPENIPILVGDVINIRSETDYIFKWPRRKNTCFISFDIFMRA